MDKLYFSYHKYKIKAAQIQYKGFVPFFESKVKWKY